MSGIYEYRRAPSKGAVLLGTVCVLLITFAVMLTERDYLMLLAWALASATITWLAILRPVAGIRIDDDYLILSAWRTPHMIPLDDIAHLRATHVRIQTEVVIVFKDGREEGVLAADLPELTVLSKVMAERGIAVRVED